MIVPKSRRPVPLATLASVLIHSDILMRIGVPHAFTTRHGGVSLPPFDSLNFGNPGELPAHVARDSKTNIERNFQIVLDELGCEERRIMQVHQVHGPDVLVVKHAGTSHSSHSSTITPTHAALTIKWGETKADAIVSDDPACVVAVRVADCCPVLIASNDGRVVAAVHAGWRGVISGVAPAAVATLKEHGAKGIVAAIGPCISSDHFEVGPEVAAEFRRVFGTFAAIVRNGAGDRSLVDLKEALRVQVLGCGVSAVDVLPHCTVRDASLFFSHRRENGISGRMVGVIGASAR